MTEDSPQRQDDIERREREREERARAAMLTQRAARTHAEFVYETKQDCYWDLIDGKQLTDRAVDALIPRDLWRVEVTHVGAAPPQDDPEPQDGEENAPRRRGRPATGQRPRERLIRPSIDIRQTPEQVMDGKTWWPGEPRIVRNKYLNTRGQIVNEPGWRFFNEYVPAPELQGDPEQVGCWLTHVEYLIPNETEREAFIDYCAFMIQFPGIKCNCGILLAGKPGIGKDAMLEPLRLAVGAWNADTINPSEIFTPYNAWVRNVMLTVNELEPGDEHTAWDLMKRMKPLTVAPPNGLSSQDKYEKRSVVLNVLRIFAMTNDINSIYMEDNDRRWLVINSPLEAKWHLAAGKPNYFIEYHEWVHDKGFHHVAAYLMKRDLSKYNPKEPFVDTAMHSMLMDMSNDAPDDAFGLALSRMGDPEIFFGFEIKEMAGENIQEIEKLFKSQRGLMRRAERSNYRLVKVDEKPEARWSFTIPGTKMILKSKYAFVKSHIPISDAVVRIWNRGNEIAKHRAAVTNIVSNRNLTSLQ